MSRLLIIVAAAVTGASAGTPVVDAPSAPVLELASVVIAYQIEGHPDQTSTPSFKDNPTVGGYPILGLKLVTSPTEIRRLGRLVSAERVGRRNPDICFYPGLVLSFVVEGTTNEAFICLECRNMSGAGPTELVGLSDGAYTEFSNLYRKLFKSAPGNP